MYDLCNCSVLDQIKIFVYYHKQTVEKQYYWFIEKADNEFLALLLTTEQVLSRSGRNYVGNNKFLAPLLGTKQVSSSSGRNSVGNNNLVSISFRRHCWGLNKSLVIVAKIPLVTAI